MKKLILSIIVVMSCFTASAQEKEKKKDSPPPSRGQERAINESGISVKTEPKKNSSSKTAAIPAPSSDGKKSEEKSKAPKKPD